MLITLGVIGVVAAMTMPVLIQKHNNQVVETRLKKFYSSVNQAIIRAEFDYGDRETWYNFNDIETDKNGAIISGNSNHIKWVNKYFVPYMNVLKVEEISISGTKLPIIYCPDGSSLFLSHGTTLNDWVYFPGNYKKCIGQNLTNHSQIGKQCGKCAFYFNYHPLSVKDKYWKLVGNNFEPYKYGWNGTLESLEQKCQSDNSNIVCCTCAALIQYNGWKIPNNYQPKARY